MRIYNIQRPEIVPSTTPREINTDSQSAHRPNFPKAICGTIAGMLLGYVGFALLWKLGFYAMVVPGTMIGLGCGAQSGGRSLMLGLFAAFVAMGFGLFIEWKFFSFIADDSFGYFLTNLSELKTQTKLLITAGAFAGFWFGRGR